MLLNFHYVTSRSTNANLNTWKTKFFRFIYFLKNNINKDLHLHVLLLAYEKRVSGKQPSQIFCQASSTETT